MNKSISVPRVGVLFVCMGNICRSPTAEGVFANLVNDRGMGSQFNIDSAGTIAHHVGEAPDPRSQSTAKRRGIDISVQRSRQVRLEDFELFHYIVAMDTENLDVLSRSCPKQHRDRIHLFCDFTIERKGESVPDPYYGGARGFDIVFDLVSDAAHGLFDTIHEAHLKHEQR